MRDYGKEKEAITSKYKSDAAIYYRKLLHMRAKGIEFTELAPPRNTAEAAERAADKAQKAVKDGYEKTAESLRKFDEQYQI